MIHTLWWNTWTHMLHVFIWLYNSNCTACKESKNDPLLAENCDLNEDRWPITKVGLAFTRIRDQLFYVVQNVVRLIKLILLQDLVTFNFGQLYESSSFILIFHYSTSIYILIEVYRYVCMCFIKQWPKKSFDA